ncbi:MAG: hypothetical protein U5P41_05645 [Gammaproteobacteria bacterium]|nr:hypothetical protein [Gammaproteobacteria bacterium]
MDVKDTVREKERQVLSMHPHEQERIEKCTQLIIDQDNKLLYQAYEKQLDQILSTSSPEQARKHIDRMEHTLTKSSLISPLLDNSPDGKRCGFGCQHCRCHCPDHTDGYPAADGIRAL